METGRMIPAVASVVIIAVYALGSARWVSTGDAWYRQLEQPAWQPPDVVFGIVWPYNFAALIASGIAVAAYGSGTVRVVWLVALAVSVTAALAWARLFYVDHAMWWAATALTIAAIVTVPIVAAAFGSARLGRRDPGAVRAVARAGGLAVDRLRSAQLTSGQAGPTTWLS